MRNNFGNFGKNLTPTLLRLFAVALIFATVMAQIPVPGARAAGTDLTLTKTIEGGVTTAQVGDIIRYRIHFACSNLTTPCGKMEITDELEDGLIYLPPPASSVPAGFTISYDSPSRIVTITKLDDMLLDGSQYDAVIAVQVDYDLRPLPATINNTVTGRIDPDPIDDWEEAPDYDAPPITIGTANPYWAIAKTLSSPIINPTVDTDVTYQVQLCPTTPPTGQGNVPLTNIVITDTLPTGAAFVSASNGGTFSSGVVTWPTILGPVYPTTCVTRFVTIRYNSPSGSPPGPFIVGFDNDPDPDNLVTNTVDFDADYTPSTGACTSPCTGGGGDIDHPIAPISEVPSYSKSDTGDPVGFTGTGRFVLSLNTNNTNYPSNSLTLIDNLPPELQVTSITSGEWAATFDYVRAFVEYSTNNGSSYTAFPGQPIIYSTNATYVAPAANITNVRWRFEYDPDKTAPFAGFVPGLPYTWGFTTSPQIRVTPRAAPIDTDGPTVVSLPAAVAGSTYTNCLRVSRIDSTATPMLDACDDETMTVQGTFVSLRVSKNETPGGTWDDLSDPNISIFTQDGTILPGDTMRYTITVEVTERSSTDLVNPTIRDTLPVTGFTFVRNGTAYLDGTPLATQPTFTPSLPTYIQWDFPGLTVNPLPLGSHFLTVEFFGYVPRGQDPDTYTNDGYAVTDSVDAYCETGGQVNDDDAPYNDVDGDGDPTDPACLAPDTYVVERSAALRGEKWIRSIDPLNNEVVLATTFLPDASCPDGGTVGVVDIPTNPFTRYPCISQAFPEGALPTGQFAPPTLNITVDDFEYNLRIFNDGNVPMLSYVLYDILPYVGDTGSGGVLANASRLSEFRPIIDGPVSFISGPAGLSAANFTIEYNNTTNPCRPEVFDQPTGGMVPGGCNDVWSSTFSADTRSYRIRLNAGSFIDPASTSSEVRFGVPMHIPQDAPPTGFDLNDALSHEIAWNSYSHVGAYDSDPGGGVIVQDLLASEPRKVGITVPERMSVGNRVWRDADNSGTINAPDDTTPGIFNVVVNLYSDTDDNGIPDGAAISTTTTDTEGYYLFSNIPYDSADMDNNRYIIGIPAGNFDLVGDPLYQLRSSTGTPAVATYTTPTSNVIDSADDGIDPATLGQEVFSWSFTLQPSTEPTNEADLSNNARDGLAGQRRGVNGERNNNSDLTLDFGFFGGTDVPFSIGNHVWKDNGQTAAPGVFNYAQRNDGIRQTDEPPVVGALVRLYRDGNANGTPEAAEMIRTDLTDAGGFYLFDNLDPGPYFVEIPASNFAAGQPLAGWYSSQPTGTETLGVNGGATTADIDNDDNGVNANFPETTGVFSGVVVLIRGTPEPLGETYLSGDPDPGSPANQGYNPTGWDGPGSIGRFGETDATSNITIDFGFIPPMSLGNRVWIDEGAGTIPFRTGYNNALQDGTEAGVSGVIVQLWRDTSAPFGTLQVTSGPGQDTLMDTDMTDATGYYLFERMQPASNYFVHIPAANFTGAGALVNFLSSTDTAAPLDDAIDKNDNGFDSGTPSTTGISSPQIAMSYNGEPLTPANETDINNSGPYGPNNVGNYGQEDGDSNLTMDFGFVRPPRSIGNRVWYDPNNNGVINAGDDFDTGTAGDQPGIPGVRVNLYLDANGNGLPDDFNSDTILDNNDAIAFDLTDANGYYLFDKLPPNGYVIAVDYTNFAAASLLEGYASSSGTPHSATYTNPPVTNPDSADHGIDRLQMGNPALSPYGILSASINLTATPAGAPTGETGSGDTSSAAGFNPTAGDGPLSRGRFGETDDNSNLTIDFGFFIPMSLGNRVFLDDGTGGGTYNNGIMDGGELPIANVRVELYQDANLNGVPDGASLGFDVTDSNGYYLFDDLAAGSYVVLIAGGNFTASFDPDGGGPLPTAAGALLGRGSSTPTGTETLGVNGGATTADIDRDDNGINNGTPTTTPAVTPGILSGTITLVLNSEPTGETELSGQADPGSPANLAFNPTGWDGPLPGSRGRWEEKDANSNLTIDFGFIPVYSLGNRVFFDTNNNNIRNGAEVGVFGVRVQLFASDGVTQIPVGADGILNTADDGLGGMLTPIGGYYLFNNLPAGDYIVKIPASNFGAGQPLQNTWSSATTISNAGVITETAAPDPDTDVDSDDNGTRVTSGPFTGDIVSLIVTLGPGASEPTVASIPPENDIPAGGQGQPDAQANVTVDFGFYTIRLGDTVWGDINNNGLLAGGETGINGVTVQLWSQDLSTMLASTTTITVGPNAGIYTFTGLAAGNYIVRIPASDFNSPLGVLRNYRSSTSAGAPPPYEPAPNPDTATVDLDDNGTETGGNLGAGGYVQTSAFALTPAAEQAFNNGTGTTTENRVDFGFTELVALGNRVWFDTGAGAFTNNGILDAGEVGVDNVRVQLYTSAGVEVPVGPDGVLGTADDALGGILTSGGGYYSFDRLYPGSYYAFIPATQFQSGGPLFTYFSSAGNSADQTSDEAVGPTTNENGMDDALPATNGIRSINFTLTPGTMPIAGDVDTGYTGTLADANVNFTDDFGFVQKYSVGNRVWFDTNNGSTINGAEVGKDGVVVNLYAASNLAVILATDTTSNGGYYLFDDLYPGDYVVSVATSNFTGLGQLVGYWSSGTSRTAAGAITETAAALANSDTDSDDNGTLQTAGLLNGAVISSTVTLGPTGSTEPTLEGDLEPVVGQGNQADGRANMTVDFGFYRLEIGNLVYSDDNTNGTYDGSPTDTLLSGVTVQLYAANGTTLITSTTTSPSGDYRFDGQPEGDYVVKVVAPTGTTSTIDTFDSPDNANPDVNTNNNDNGIGEGAGTVAAGTLTMTAAEVATNITVSDATGTTTDLTVDFGFVPLYSLGNRVWFDTNNNSLMDGAEVGVNGVVVDLYYADVSGNPTGAILASDTTTASGFYLFDDLSPRDYVVVIRQANFASGGVLVGYWSSATSLTAGGATTETSAPDADADATDADDNGTLQTAAPLIGAVISKAVTLGPTGGTEPTGEIATQLESGVLGNQGNQPDDRANMTVDFGFYRVEIGNLVYLDGNGNGNYDGAPDTVISGATVRLFASNGTTEILVGPDGILGTLDDFAGGVTTNAGGIYTFSGLPTGDYIVRTTAPTGMTSTIDTFNAADTADPDTNADDNDNGVGLGFGAVSANTLTMIPGEVAANITITNATGTTLDTTVDFGFVQMVAIGNRVWYDTGTGGGISNNGILDGGETGVPSVTVELYTSTGTFVNTTTTDGSGRYEFDRLYPGTYYIFIPNTEFGSGKPLENYFSSVNHDTDQTRDETASPGTNENGMDDAPATNGIRSIDFTLTPNTMPTTDDDTGYTGVLTDDSVNFTADFGFTQKYSIGNRVWFDTDNSSTINGSEEGKDGVTVNLYAASNLAVILATDVTTNGGYYLFDDLYPGDYVVSVDVGNFTGVLGGYRSSGTTISSAGIVSETTAALANSDIDSDDNGTLQTGGTLVGSVISSTITLGPSGSTEPTSETDLDGGSQGNQTDGRANMTVDFGFYTQTLGNLVWSDTDKNGQSNGSEAGINLVPVELWSGDGTLLLASTTTAGGGLYSFPNLAQGDYTVRVTSPVGTVSSTDAFALTDTTNPTTNTDNNDNGVGTGSGTIVSNIVTLTPGAAQTSNTVTHSTGSTTNPSMDFGFTPVFSLGNRVWFDTNNNSLIDGAEVGIDGVTVNLYAASDLTTVIASQTTANSGYYLFNGLQAGDYVVSVPGTNFIFDLGGVLTGYWSSATSRAADGSIIETTAALANNDTDIDDNGTLQTSGALDESVISSVVTLGPATTAEPSGETDLDATLPGNQQGQPDTQANMTVDFGFYTIILGNQVWNDFDNSGLLDAPDGATPGFDGVTVELWSADGLTQLDSVTTATVGPDAGVYTFTGLPAGDYIVRLPDINFNPGGVLRDYRSSTGPLPPAYEPAPDADTNTTDSDDNGTETNGLLGLNGYIQTLPVTLTPGAEQSFDNTTGTTTEFRVDFGVNKSPQIDLTVTKTDGQAFYLAGGTLTYTVVVTNKGPADAGDPGTPTPGTGMTVSDPLPSQITSWTWTCASPTYGCDGGTGAPFTDELFLPQLASVTYTVVAQVDPAATGTLTNSVTVTPPTSMTDMMPPDNTATDIDEPAALTVTKDDSVQIVAPGATLTYAIIVTNTGAADLTGIQLVDTLPTGVTFVSATNGGTFASGQVTWPLFNLVSGGSTQRNITVQVADAATLAAGSITSLTNTVHVEDDGSNTGGDPVEDDDDDVDQIASSNVKTLTGSNQAGSANPNVLIGEILTYSIRIDIPVGTINNLQAVDVLEHGLAFVGCDATTPISSGALVLAQNPCLTPTPPALIVQAEPVTNPSSEDAGRRVTFDFGQVQNTSGSTQTLIVTYQVVVLEIDDNVDGVTGLNNVVTWIWEGGSLSGSAPEVEIVEPDLSIDKSVNPVVAPLGSTVQFSIFIEHTDTSTAPAYDVLVFDELPARLRLDPTSVRVRGTSSLPAPRITTTATTVSVFWSSFPIRASATITFNAIFVGPSPTVNEASVQWASLQIDPNPILQPQSPYNQHSTERRYDPADPANNIYRRVSTITLVSPELPETGFAPDVKTVLPAQPLDKMYQALGDMWLEIPALNLKMPIVGIPTTADGWDLTWLANQAGYLEGTTFPSQVGTTGITGHVYLADGTPGPFVNLGNLAYGNQVILHANGQRYTYEVRTSRVVLPKDLSVFKNDGYTWMTLITCKEYIPSLKKYDYRLAVRAVLLRVEAETVSK